MMALRRGLGADTSIAANVLVMLFALLVSGFMLVPLVYLGIRAAAADQDLLRLILQPRTLRLLVNTVLLAAVVTFCATAIAVPLAWLTTRTDLPLRRFWAIALAVPLAIPSYLGAYTLVAALGPRGMVQQLLAAPLGIERLPEIYGFTGAALALILFCYPYAYLSVRAALRRLDPALEEASRSLGYGAAATFYRVVLPGLRPAIASGGLLIALYVFSDFGAVSFMQYDTFTRAIYVQYQAAFDRTYGAVLGLILVACTLLVLWADLRTRGRARYDRLGPGAQREAATVRLGRWRWPAFAFCALVLAFALLLPAAVVVYWLFRGLAAGETLVPVQAAALNSVWAAALAALATMLLAVPVALLIVRSRRWGRLLETVTYIGYALPGMVVALGMVFFGIHVAHPFYQTMVLLVAGYVVMFLPQGVGVMRNALLTINPHVEEGARTLGATPLRVFRTVTFPLVRSGLVAGVAMVFLTVIKELPVTLLLSPTGFTTLAGMVWAGTSEGFYTRAAPAALLLIFVSFLSVVLLVLDDYGRLPRRSHVS